MRRELLRHRLVARLLGSGLLGIACLCTAGPAAATPSSRPAWADPLPRPLQVVHPFVAPRTPYGPGHRGVDLRSVSGAAVYAPGDGTVRFAGAVAGRGVVSVDSGGLRFSYEPVTARVRTGQAVTAGTVLGTLDAGHPGCADCLHWGVRRGERYLDPLQIPGSGVRLLPLDGGTTGSARASRARGPTDSAPPLALPAAGGLALAGLALRRR